MKAVLFLAALATFIGLGPAHAACTASALSKPNDLFGQTFRCSDGTTLRYQRGVLGDTITNEDTGDRFYASPLSDRSDEYDSMFGRSFDGGLRVKRDSILGDRITGDPY